MSHWFLFVCYYSIIHNTSSFLVHQVNWASSAWRTWSTRSTQLVRTSVPPTTSCYRSNCQWLVTLPGIKLVSSRTWETRDFVAQILTPSSDNWTEEKKKHMKNGHWTVTSRMPYFFPNNKIFNFFSYFFGGHIGYTVSLGIGLAVHPFPRTTCSMLGDMKWTWSGISFVHADSLLWLKKYHAVLLTRLVEILVLFEENKQLIKD